MRLLLCGLLSLCVPVLSGYAQEVDSDRDARPVVPPVPRYPTMAAILGLQGTCSVHFSVDEQGHPFGLVTFCTEPIFCYESKRAVSRVEFEPKYESGVPVIRTDVVYPLEYTLSDYDPATGEHVAKPFRTDKPPRPCREVPVS